MSNLKMVNGQVVDVDEPVRRGEWLLRIPKMTEDIASVMRKATNALTLARHVDDTFGRWVGELDNQVKEHHKRLPGIENKVSDSSYKLLTLERKVEELERRLHELEKR